MTDIESAFTHAEECRRALGRVTKQLRVDSVSNPSHPVVKLFEQAAMLEKNLRDFLWEETDDER